MAQRKFTEEEARERKNARQREYAKKTHYAVNSKYEKENVRRYVLKVVPTVDKDIFDKLESVDNISGYLKSLIRADIEKNN